MNKTLHNVKKSLHTLKQSTMATLLKFIVIIAAIIGFLFLIFLIPNEGQIIARVNPEVAYMYMPCLIYIWIMAIPYYLVLMLLWKIFDEISKDNPFSDKNSIMLRKISILSFLELALCLIAMLILGSLKILPPGIAILLILLSFTSLVLLSSAYTLAHLTLKASKLK